MKTTNYFNTFIEVAEDCPAAGGEVPPQKEEKKSAALLQYEMISAHPYAYTSDDILFHLYAVKQKIPPDALQEEREKFFSKGRPCFRSSPLPKRYGWGVHSDGNGKIAIYSLGSEDYERFLSDAGVKRIRAMRSRRR